jgi:hypothetical protein
VELSADNQQTLQVLLDHAETAGQRSNSFPPSKLFSRSALLALDRFYLAGARGRHHLLNPEMYQSIGLLIGAIRLGIVSLDLPSPPLLASHLALLSPAHLQEMEALLLASDLERHVLPESFSPYSILTQVLDPFLYDRQLQCTGVMTLAALLRVVRTVLQKS